MELIAATDPLSHSADLTAENIERLREFFPQAVTENGGGKRIDFDVLRELLGGELATGEEKYGLNWHGKRAARRLALTPSTGTLRPAPEDSVDWGSTQNLMIEGDNLEVLKLLQKSYAGKVKMIYIDPPYNTGNDFVYKDDFRDSIGNYQRITGQRDTEGAKLTTSAESSGRFHTDWLNMMYPRLMLARNLLREDGVMFMSIDEHEADSLKKLCVEVFGEENFISAISVLVNPRGRHLDQFIAKTHDQLLIFTKSAVSTAMRGQAKEGAMLAEYDKEDSRGKYRELGLRNRNQAFNPVTRPSLFYPLYIRQSDGHVSIHRTELFTEEILPVTADGIKTCWTWGKEKVVSDNALLIAHAFEDGTWRVFRKDYLEDEEGGTATTLPKSIWLDKDLNNDYGRRTVKELFGEIVFDFPKPLGLLSRLLSLSMEPGGIVLDFFAGSGTTGHAVFEASAIENDGYRFILVQLPELTKRADFKTIPALTEERLRRAAIKIKATNPLFHGDLGFRVFKLDTTSIRPWDPTLPVTEQRLLGEVDNILPERTEQDMLYELLLKRGLELTVPIVERTLAGKQVFAVSTGDLIACLAPHIESADVEALAEGIVTWHKELAPPPVVDPNAPLEKPSKFDPPLVVFRDTAFADDVAKSNLTEILKQHNLTDVRSL